MKSTVTKGKTIGSSSMAKEKEASHDNNVRRNYIATAAYYKAQLRGFLPGRELADWLEAEAGFDELMEH